MAQDKESETKISKLRRHAEAALAEKFRDASDISTLSPEDVQKLVHELKVHQIELEMQNEELRTAQIALEKSVGKYLDLYDFAPVGYFTLDRKGIILDANLTAVRLLGIEKESLIKRPLSRFVCREDADTLYLHINRVFGNADKQTCEIRIVRKDGSEFPAQLDGMAVQDGDEHLRQCRIVITDITERKKREDALRESEALYRDLVENIEDLVCKHDLQGNLIFVNSSSANLLGYSPADLVGTNLRSYLPLAVRDQFDAYLAAVQRDGCASGLMLIKTKTGEKRIWEYRNTLGTESVAGPVVLGIARDATDRKRAEKELRESERKYRELVQNTNSVIIRWNRDGTIKFLNEYAQALFGYGPDEAVGQDVGILVPAKESSGRDLSTLIEDIVNHPNRYVNNINENVCRDGRRVWMAWTNRPILDGEGHVAEILAVGSDITAQKRAETALLASEDRYRGLFEHAPLMYVITRNEQGTPFISGCNELFLRSVGYSREEVVGQPLASFYSLTSSADLLEAGGYARAMGGEFFIGERQLRKRDGRLTPTLLYTAPDVALSGEVIGTCAMFVDITEQKKAEEAARASESFLNSVIDQSPYPMWISDDRGTLIRANNALRGLLQISDEEVVGKYNILKDNVVEEQGILPLVKSVFEKGETVRFEIRYDSSHVKHIQLRHPTFVILDVTIFPIKDSGGKITNAVIQHMDITARKKAEEELRESETRYRALIDNLQVGISVINPKMEIIAVNKLFQEYYPHVRPGDGQLCYAMYNDPPRPSPCSYCPCVQSFQDGMVHESVTETPAGNRIRNYRLVSCPIVDERGQVELVIELVEDITEKRTLEAQLFQAQKMEAVGTLAGGIAHDFNNLLHIISGHAELLDMELAERKLKFGELDAIRQSAHRGADLVKQILTFSRRIDATFESINLNEEVRSTERLLYRTIPKMIEIDLRLEERLDRVRVDSTQIEQMLINLAVNAKDAMPEGGRLVIETRNVNLDEDYCKSHAEIVPGQYVLLRVSDTGHGIEEDVRQHIFEPFFTTKGLADGTGLGLATAFGIVKIHKGHITCESEVGRGTIFSIYFPAAEAGKPDMEQEQEVSAVAGGTERILVVDDEPMIRDLAKRILEKSGYSVLTAGSGKEGIEVYTQHKSEISLVILDLIMPEMGGKQCLEELLKINPQVKVLVASGFAVKGDTKTFLDTEAKGIVPKPFNMRELLRSVRHVLDGM